MQIVAEHEAKGDTVLPTNVLTDMVRAYATNMQTVMPQFLAASFDMLRDSQSKALESLSAIPAPMVPGFDAMRKQQEAFLKTMMGAWPGVTPPEAPADDIADIKRQLDELQKKLSKL